MTTGAPYQVVEETKFKCKMSPDDAAVALVQIASARQTTKILVQQLKAAVLKGDSASMEAATQALLVGAEPKLCSAVEINKRLPLNTKKPAFMLRRSLEWCLEAPQKIDLYYPLDEPVLVHGAKKAKNSGEVRAICDFGPIARARQSLIERVISVHYAPRNFQFTHSGIHRSIRLARAAVAEGMVFAARLDIRNCFGSFVLDELQHELPLPSEVVEYAVVGQHMKVEHGTSKGHKLDSSSLQDLLLTARLGMPLGSTCSPIVAAYLLSKLDWPAPEQVCLLNYVDDFLLLAGTPARLEAAIGMLADALSALPGGTFEFGTIATCDLVDGIGFIGHHLQIEGGKLRVAAAHRNTEALLARLLDLETRLGNEAYLIGKKNIGAAIVTLAQFLAYGRGWSAAFRECDDVANWTSFWQEELHSHIQTLGLSMSDVEGAVDESMAYKTSGYALS